MSRIDSICSALDAVLAIIARPPRDIAASNAADFERDGRDLQGIYADIVNAREAAVDLRRTIESLQELCKEKP